MPQIPMNATTVPPVFLTENLIDTSDDNPSGGVAVQPELVVAPTLSRSEGEPLRHILLGSPGGVRQTIHLLHMLRYVENALWSPLIAIPNDQLIIAPRQGEVMSLLVRNLQS